MGGRWWLCGLWVVVGVVCPCVETVCWILCTIAVLVQDVAEAEEGGGCVGCGWGVSSLSRDGVLDLVYHIQSRLLFRLFRMLRRLRDSRPSSFNFPY